jgi:Flp pilus assembly protein TadD
VKRISLDFVISEPVGESGRKAASAVALLRRGERDASIRLYREAVAANPEEATTWSNLGVYALVGGDSATATAHLRRALRLAPGCADAFANLALVLLAQDRRQETLQALERAIALDPGHARARSNLGALLLAKGELDKAEACLSDAEEACPDAWRIPYERARLARIRGDAIALRSHALAAIHRAASSLPRRLPALRRKPLHASSGLADALCEAGDLLRAANQPFHLMAGTLLALVRDGELIGHDKDIDLAFPWDTDRDGLAALFRGHPRFTAPDGPIVDEKRWAFSVVHAPTGIGIDLFFFQHAPDGVLAGLGTASAMLFSRVRPFALGELEWRGRPWAIPSPPGQYLEDVYGPRWRDPDPYFDTVLSNPSRTPESIPVAIDIGLLRLGDALQSEHWRRALSLCRQLLARQQFPEVAALAEALQQRSDPAQP